MPRKGWVHTEETRANMRAAWERRHAHLPRQTPPRRGRDPRSAGETSVERATRRFWAHVDQSGDGCWPWTARLDKWGYGHSGGTASGRPKASMLAHRLAYILTYGAIAPGMLVCHHCDNPPCVRPDHLFMGTPMDNIRDMDAKGRRAVRRPAGLGRVGS
jgi:hypothetical protein